MFETKLCVFQSNFSCARYPCIDQRSSYTVPPSILYCRKTLPIYHRPLLVHPPTGVQRHQHLASYPQYTEQSLDCPQTQQPSVLKLQRGALDGQSLRIRGFRPWLL